jgi:hypothetical protein
MARKRLNRRKARQRRKLVTDATDSDGSKLQTTKDANDKDAGAPRYWYERPAGKFTCNYLQLFATTCNW